MNNRYLYLLIALVAAARLIPHPDNFTPIGALALFSGAYIEDKRGFLVPLVALALGDVIMGLYSPVVMAAVYLGFALSTGVGILTLRRTRTSMRYVIAVGASAIVFFLVSNFGDWYVFYPRNPGSLIQCYINGLPFLVRSVAGDACYCALLFGIWETCIRVVDRPPLQN